ncbi:response regulator transcription factor [Virgibacillus sp. LDC-1]|uniref:LuxR C-terminal-related transcriptional regulator n=1 Tax=Virgibacillus sp. LDC-1 TaxID=3039856 RepID=UPI0024DE8925|nr:response regulator transcription factor [Virgibacillus sp. LDC-1]
MIKVVIIDEEKLFSNGLRIILEAEKDMRVLELEKNAEIKWQEVVAFSPNVMLLHVNKRDYTLLNITRELQTRFVDMKVVVILAEMDMNRLRNAMLLGAQGYLLWDINAHSLIEAIRNVYHGQFVFSEEIGRRIISSTIDEKEKMKGKLLEKGIDVNWRDIDILYLLYYHYKNNEIANELQLSEKTVRDYVSKVYKKLGVGKRQEVAHYLKKVMSEDFFAMK